MELHHFLLSSPTQSQKSKLWRCMPPASDMVVAQTSSCYPPKAVQPCKEFSSSFFLSPPQSFCSSSLGVANLRSNEFFPRVLSLRIVKLMGLWGRTVTTWEESHAPRMDISRKSALSAVAHLNGDVNGHVIGNRFVIAATAAVRRSPTPSWSKSVQK